MIDFADALFHSLCPDEPMMQTQPKNGAAAPGPTLSDSAIDRVLRRSLLLLTRDSSTGQDRLDLAEFADEVGASDLADIARNLAMLRQGFADDQPSVATPTGSIERAVDELEYLMQDGAGSVSPAAMVRADNAVAACAAFCRLLSAPLDQMGEGELAGLLLAWRNLGEAKANDPRGYADAALASLMEALAASELSAFLHRNHALAFPPFGSPRLLHHAARLGHGGLGPYLSCIGNVVRSGRDVLGLIVLAAGENSVDAIERWVPRLAAYLPEHLAEDLADELADLGLRDAVRALLHSTLRRSDRHGLLRRLRDAALDLGDDALAIDAQHHVANLMRFNAVEWRCLGALLATKGSNAAAEEALVHAERIAPTDPVTVAHLAALRSGDFDAFAVKAGFDTPEYRQRLRFARRTA